jgi:hypothetical protein
MTTVIPKHIKFSDAIDTGDDTDVLACPNCDSFYLHHDAVTVYDRDEDASDVTQVRVENGVATTMTIPNDVSRNPSSRRHGMAIEFWCEGCGGEFELTIAQDRGVTEIGWRGERR